MCFLFVCVFSRGGRRSTTIPTEEERRQHHRKGERETMTGKSGTTQKGRGRRAPPPKKRREKPAPLRRKRESSTAHKEEEGMEKATLAHKRRGRSSLWVVLPSPPSLFSKQGKAKQGVVGRDSSSSALSPLWRCCFPILLLLRGAAFSPPDLKMVCFLDNFLFDFLETAKKTQAWSVGQIREASTSFSKEVPFFEPSLFLDGAAFTLQSVLWVVVLSPLSFQGNDT